MKQRIYAALQDCDNCGDTTRFALPLVGDFCTGSNSSVKRCCAYQGGVMAGSRRQSARPASWSCAAASSKNHGVNVGSVSERRRATMRRALSRSWRQDATSDPSTLSDESAVVDQHGRVRGVEGLRIVDASIVPTLTTRGMHASAV